MADQMVAPLTPYLGQTETAMAGSQAVVFTATDRKIIEERGGTVDKTKSFLSVLARKPLLPEVENEETTVPAETNIKEMEERKKEHERMLKYAAISPHQERVEITGKVPDKVVLHDDAPIPAEPQPTEVNPTLHAKTVELAKELNLDPTAMFDKLNLEQKELYNLIYRIKELHLQRLLSGSQQEFIALSDTIKQETLAASRPEALGWLQAQLDTLTKTAAEYKLNFLKSLQTMGLDPKHQQDMKWLKKTITKLATATY